MKVDLRSDTVTKPSLAMRAAIAKAEVGDDVFGEDPTAQELQRRVADLLGKEAALFVPSGTMANQLGVRAQTHHGDEIIIARTSHQYNYESGGLAAISGVQVNVVDGERGRFRREDIESKVRPDDQHFGPTSLICIENTTNVGGGAIFDLDEIKRIREFACTNSLGMHLDGARLFNACVETNIPAREYAAQFDSVSVCLSKGLGAPVGSVLAGTAEVIRTAHRFRKMLGGGMRQVGILAAAGLYAIEHNIDRLKEDHQRAKRLGDAVTSMGSLKLKWPVDTNFVMIELSDSGMPAVEAVSRLKAEGVGIMNLDSTSLRAVTHLDIDDEGINYAIDAFRRVFG